MARDFEAALRSVRAGSSGPEEERLFKKAAIGARSVVLAAGDDALALLSLLRDDLGATVDWLARRAYEVDLFYLRRMHPNIMPIERWFRQKSAGEGGPAIQLGL